MLNENPDLNITPRLGWTYQLISATYLAESTWVVLTHRQDPMPYVVHFCDRSGNCMSGIYCKTKLEAWQKYSERVEDKIKWLDTMAKCDEDEKDILLP